MRIRDLIHLELECYENWVQTSKNHLSYTDLLVHTDAT